MTRARIFWITLTLLALIYAAGFAQAPVPPGNALPVPFHSWVHLRHDTLLSLSLLRCMVAGVMLVAMVLFWRYTDSNSERPWYRPVAVGVANAVTVAAAAELCIAAGSASPSGLGGVLLDVVTRPASLVVILFAVVVTSAGVSTMWLTVPTKTL